MIANELKEKAIKDILTGLLNRQGKIELIEKVSIGTSLMQPGESFNIDILLKMADKNMYAVKYRKKNHCNSV